MVEDKKELNAIEKIEDTNRKLEEANKRTEELLKQQEQLMARSALSGKSEAGNEPKPIDPELKKKEDLKNYFKGGIIEKLIK